MRYRVEVAVRLLDGVTAEDAEIDACEVRMHSYEVSAKNDDDAIELAKDQFHGSVAIGVLDAVDITYDAKVLR